MLSKVEVSEMVWAHGAGRETARTYFEFYHPEVERDELERLLSVIDEKHITPKQSSASYDPSRNKLAAALWIAGASLRQLGLAFGVTRETMLRARDKVLMGNKTRLAKPELTFNRVLTMRDFGLELAKKHPAMIQALDPFMLGKLLKDIPERMSSESESSAYDQVDIQSNIPKAEETV